LSLDDRVCDYLPSYTSHGKDRTTIRHVMTHSAGVPFATGPRPDLKRMDDSQYAREMLGNLKPIYRPGLVHIYHALTWGPLVREIVSAANGKNIRDVLAAEILAPLGSRWTNYGVAEADLPQRRSWSTGSRAGRGSRRPGRRECSCRWRPKRSRGPAGPTSARGRCARDPAGRSASGCRASRGRTRCRPSA